MNQRFLVEPDSASAEPIRTLRLAVETRLGTRKTKALVVTSPRRRDGRTTIAANLAVVTSLVQRPVLLIDADFRNPRLHEIFGRPRSPGLIDALRDRIDPWEVVHTFRLLGGLHLLTAGSPLAAPGDVAASPAMAGLLERAQADYKAVVIDAPAVLAGADASGLASHPGTDVIVVVNSSGKRRHLTGALHKLAQTDASVLGLVLNRQGALTDELY